MGLPRHLGRNQRHPAQGLGHLPRGLIRRCVADWFRLPVELRVMKHEDTKGTKGHEEELSYVIIGAALEVHRTLGPGLLESAYEACLSHELRLRRVPFRRQTPLPVVPVEVLAVSVAPSAFTWLEGVAGHQCSRRAWRPARKSPCTCRTPPAEKGGWRALRQGHRWAVMGARYDRRTPRRSPAQPNAPAQPERSGLADAREVWDALDRGDDPTAT